MRSPPLRAAVLLLLAPLAGVAQDGGPDPRLFAPPSSDESPTSWSCTVDTLIAGVECVFESESEPAKDAEKQAAENAKRAATLSARACAEVARLPAEAKPDKDLLAVCQRDFADAAEGCGGSNKRPLLDAAGRFSPDARPCYQAMAEVLRRVHLMGAVSVKCCRCLMRNRCASSSEQCNQDIVAAQTEPSACISGACAAACAGAILREERPAPAGGAGGVRRKTLTDTKEL